MEGYLKKIRVLVVEDEIVVSEDIQQRLTKLGFDVAGAADTAADAIELATSKAPDLVLMDIMLHGRPDGILAAEHLRRELDLPVIYLTAHSDSATLEKAKLTDPAGYLVKPFDEQQLRIAIELAPHRHEMERKARRTANWLNATLTSIGDAVIVTDTNTEILLLNQAAEKLTGWTRKDAVGKPSHEIVRLIDQKTRLPIADPAARALTHGLIVHIDPGTLLIQRGGGERHVDDSASPILDEENNILGAVVILIDATDRVASERRNQELAQRVAALLDEKNKYEKRGNELDAFAAAVSHDLRSPLNIIAGYTQILAAEYREQLDNSGHQFLDRVRDAAHQMSGILEDYLVYLQAANDQPLYPATVKMGWLARSVFSDLTTTSKHRTIEFICDAIPDAWGDEDLLRQLLLNLLGNAIKYSSRRERPVIEFAAIQGREDPTYFVRDNGAGLDLASATKLFQPFQRFHHASDFPGTGVGLSSVKRIVERHGGRVWVESVPDGGATFFFTLAPRPSSECAREI